MEIDKLKQEIEEERNEKDNFFRVSFQSPISSKEREKFIQLDYYPINPDYYFELELKEYSEKEILEIQDTGGKQRQFLRWGEFRFVIGNEKCNLQAYKSSSEEERLFIPFKDLTSGNETYGAGRYLDLTPEENLTSDAKWILDFNRAYNPWCAYSKKYSCPFVPPENYLNVKILAGEKKYRLDK
jgi:uncharacterized protein (DUF1684 family)